MSTSHQRGSPPAADSPEALQAHVEQTREQLGGTVEQLAAKTDLRKQALDKSVVIGSHLRTTATRTARTVQDRATEAAHQLQERTPEVARSIRQNAPHKVNTVATRTMMALDTRPGRIVMAAFAAAAAAVHLKRKSRKRHKARWPSFVRPKGW